MKYLFISPHIDDADLMAGGTIAKMIELGHEVTIMTFALEYEGKDLSDEFFASVNFHGATDMVFKGSGTEVRKFHEHQDEILQYLFRASKYGYDFVFAPNEDFHSDHSVIARCVKRVFKHTNLLTFTPDWNQRHFIKNYFIELSDSQVEKKLTALSFYESQKKKAYFNKDYLLGVLSVNGTMINKRYAESFQVVNLIA